MRRYFCHVKRHYPPSSLAFRAPPVIQQAYLPVSAFGAQTSLMEYWTVVIPLPTCHLYFFAEYLNFIISRTPGFSPKFTLAPVVLISMNSISSYPNDLIINFDSSFIWYSQSIFVFYPFLSSEYSSNPSASQHFYCFHFKKGISISCLGWLQQTFNWFLHPCLFPFQSSLHIAARVIFLKCKLDHVSSLINALYDWLPWYKIETSPCGLHFFIGCSSCLPLSLLLNVLKHSKLSLSLSLPFSWCMDLGI